MFSFDFDDVTENDNIISPVPKKQEITSRTSSKNKRNTPKLKISTKNNVRKSKFIENNDDSDKENSNKFNQTISFNSLKKSTFSSKNQIGSKNTICDAQKQLALEKSKSEKLLKNNERLSRILAENEKLIKKFATELNNAKNENIELYNKINKKVMNKTIPDTTKECPKCKKYCELVKYENWLQEYENMLKLKEINLSKKCKIQQIRDQELKRRELEIEKLRQNFESTTQNNKNEIPICNIYL